MYAKVTTSLAALIVIVPAMVMTTPASADQGGREAHGNGKALKQHVAQDA